MTLTDGTLERTRNAPAGPAPRVTIAIPVYNGANFLEQAASSVLRQTFADLELIIVDNASTDETSDICQRLAEQDKRVRYYRNERNLGAAPNYNRGLELARGTYFKWLAHDDWLSDNYLEACVEALDRYPEVVNAHGIPREMIDPETPFIDSEFTVPLWGVAGPIERHAMAMRMPRTCHAIFGLMRRNELEMTTLHKPYYSSDCNLVAEIALLGRFLLVPEAIFYNRRHAGQSMAQSRNAAYLNSWQDSSNTKRHSAMFTNRLKHAWEIWGRYPQIASRYELIKANARFMFAPRRMAHYFDEMLWDALPRVYAPVRGLLRKAWRSIRPVGPYMASFEEKSAETPPKPEAAQGSASGPVKEHPYK